MKSRRSLNGIIWVTKFIGNRWRLSDDQVRVLSIYIGVGKKVILFSIIHDDFIKWKPFPRYWSFVRGIHRSPAPVTGKFPAQRPAMRIFDVTDLRLNKRLSKHSSRRGFETPPSLLWRHCNEFPWRSCGIFRADLVSTMYLQLKNMVSSRFNLI